MKRGKRLGLNQLKVNVRANGQYSVTIPKKLAQAMSLTKGSIISFQYVKENEARMVRVL